MAFSITINSKVVPVAWYCHNPMTEEACKEHGLEYVDNNVIHTYYLENIGCGIVTPGIYGCIFYAPVKFDLSQPITAPLMVRLPVAQSGLIEIETFKYEHDGTISMYPSPIFVCKNMSCGEVRDLGLILIKNILGINTATLGILAIYNRNYVRDNDD